MGVDQKVKTVTCVAVPAAVFGFFGSGLGIAGFGSAVSGLIPFTVVGGCLGFAYAKGFRVIRKHKV